MKLDRQKALDAITEKIAVPLKMDVYQAAESICRIIDGVMQSALATTMAVKGVDPRNTMAIAYGGAGPTHCAGYTKGIGLAKIVIPPFGAVFSAFGAATADIRHRYELSPLLDFRDIPYSPVTLRFELNKIDINKYANEIEKYNSFADELEQRSFVDITAEGINKEKITKSYEIYARYGGQLWEIRAVSPVERINNVDDLKAVIGAFEDEYARIYAREAMVPSGGFSIISMVLDISAATPRPLILKKEFAGKDPSSALKSNREVYFNGAFIPARIYNMLKLQVGNIIEGPAIIESSDTNVVIPEDRKAIVDEYSNMIMDNK
jgi:N-methylhydantoinase A/oxoprolinase/acetone carboxylase beta subunit